jgi:RimJ/RimL family protein N-acetyltransferase
MLLVLGRCTVRDWRLGDAASLARHADDREIWRNLRDHFPHPYTLRDAQAWLAATCAAADPTVFAIEVDGAAAGGIGLHRGQDVHRLTAELGFWLGRAWWGRGIMSEVVPAVTEHGFEHLGLQRIQACVFEWNPSSMRVLEKAGYACEGRLRKAAVKDGQTIDVLMYAAVR